MYELHKFGALLFVFCLIGVPTAHQKIRRTTKVRFENSIFKKTIFTDYRTTGSGLTRTTLKRSFFIESGALFKIL